MTAFCYNHPMSEGMPQLKVVERALSRKEELMQMIKERGLNEQTTNMIGSWSQSEREQIEDAQQGMEATLALFRFDIEYAKLCFDVGLEDHAIEHLQDAITDATNWKLGVVEDEMGDALHALEARRGGGVVRSFAA